MRPDQNIRQAFLVGVVCHVCRKEVMEYYQLKEAVRSPDNLFRWEVYGKICLSCSDNPENSKHFNIDPWEEKRNDKDTA